MKIALVGYGKMGKEIEQILIARGHTISLIIDVNNTADLDADHLRDIDVAIEFTTPQTAYGNIVKCIEAGVPVVCGTTAWQTARSRTTLQNETGRFFLCLELQHRREHLF